MQVITLRFLFGLTLLIACTIATAAPCVANIDGTQTCDLDEPPEMPRFEFSQGALVVPVLSGWVVLLEANTPVGAEQDSTNWSDVVLFRNPDFIFCSDPSEGSGFGSCVGGISSSDFSRFVVAGLGFDGTTHLDAATVFIRESADPTVYIPLNEGPRQPGGMQQPVGQQNTYRIHSDVPEPATWLLLAAGLFGWTAMRKRL